MIYRRVLRPLLFAQDAERAHERTISLLAQMGILVRRSRPFTHLALRQEIAGIVFPNPVGLAAGCDKNALAVPIWPRLGFGFVEVGTVTAQPQPGNPKPRLFRLPEHKAILNRLGFNSDGADVVAYRLSLVQRGKGLPFPLGVNIGKTRHVQGEAATLDDYRASFRRLAPYASYIAVNVSSPNTPGLRQWQEKNRLRNLLTLLKEESECQTVARGHRAVPLFVKVSPDMAPEDICDVAEVVLEQRIAGIIATNTTVAREGAFEGLREEGGLSGPPLRERAITTLKRLYRATGGQIPIIGVGGIDSAEEAYERIKAGASLVQIYTALIYEGPFLPLRINQGLLRLLERDGFKHIGEAIGISSR
jgi:dihydroorotate dehydrogenase